MKKVGAVLLSGVLVAGLLCVDSANAGRVGKRQVRQQKRIQQGVASDELSRKEVRRLEREQRQIQRAKRKARQDGEVTAKERGKLERMQDRANRHIYRAKHN